VWCTVGNMAVNHVTFADVICVFDLTAVLVDSRPQCLLNIVVTMLSNMKSLLIATKQLVFFFVPRSMNNLLHRMFF